MSEVGGDDKRSFSSIRKLTNRSFFATDCTSLYALTMYTVFKWNACLCSFFLSIISNLRSSSRIFNMERKKLESSLKSSKYVHKTLLV